MSNPNLLPSSIEFNPTETTLGSMTISSELDPNLHLLGASMATGSALSPSKLGPIEGKDKGKLQSDDDYEAKERLQDTMSILVDNEFEVAPQKQPEQNPISSSEVEESEDDDDSVFLESGSKNDGAPLVKKSPITDGARKIVIEGAPVTDSTSSNVDNGNLTQLTDGTAERQEVKSDVVKSTTADEKAGLDIDDVADDDASSQSSDSSVFSASENVIKCSDSERRRHRSTDANYPIDIPLKRKINHNNRRKLWREIEARKPILTKNVSDHIKNYGKPPFVTQGIKFAEFPYELNSFSQEYWNSDQRQAD